MKCNNYMTIKNLLEYTYRPNIEGGKLSGEEYTKRVEQILSSECPKVSIIGEKVKGKETARYQYIEYMSSANGKRDLLKGLLNNKRIHDDQIRLFLALYPDPDEPIVIYDKEGRKYELNKSRGIHKKLKDFLQSGKITEERLYEMTQEKSKSILQQWNLQDTRKDGYLAATGIVSSTTGWSFDLSECRNTQAFLEKITNGEDEDLGSEAISKAIEAQLNHTPGFEKEREFSDHHELRQFLKPRTVIHVLEENGQKIRIKSVTISRNLSDMIAEIKRLLEKILIRKRAMVTVTDMLDFLGFFAHKITLSESEYYLFAEGENYNSTQLDYGVQAGLIEQNGNGLRFTFRNHRIILAARYRAILDNRLHHTQDSLAVYNLVKNSYPADSTYLEKYGFGIYRPIEIEAFRKSHVNVKFDYASIYYCVYAMYLEEELRTRFFHLLISYASDFSITPDENGISRRLRQIKALSVLTNYLFEGYKLGAKEEMMLFRVCYADNLYPFQAILINGILEKRPCYKDYIKSEFEKSCVIENGFALGQPHFFFLQSHNQIGGSPGKSFLNAAIRFEDYTWGGISIAQKIDDNRESNTMQRVIQEAFEKVEEGWRYLKAYTDSPEHYGEDDLLWYTYGIQAYALAISDIIAQKQANGRELIFTALSNPSKQRNIVEAFLLADYYTRRTNRLYENWEFNNTAYKEKHENHMYLLNGVIRFFAEYKEQTPIVPMPDHMRADYHRWLTVESRLAPRYAYLILRMLSHTDFDEKSMLDSLPEIEGIDFLPYDRIGKGETIGLHAPQA